MFGFDQVALGLDQVTSFRSGYTWHTCRYAFDLGLKFLGMQISQYITAIFDQICADRLSLGDPHVVFM